MDQNAWNKAVEEFMAATAKWIADVDIDRTRTRFTPPLPVAPKMEDF